MEKLKIFFSLLIGKAVYLILRLFKSGASAAPGLYALKIQPNLLPKLNQNLKYSLVISGTNGKTTTARLIAAIFSKAKIKYFHNRSGSNLERGIISELIKKTNIFSLPKNKVGLWEVDEAFLPQAIKKLRPKIVILTNLFRDQLDRYGEIDTLLKKWQAGLKNLKPNSLLILNADDPNISSLAKNLKCQKKFFSLKDTSWSNQTLSHASDATLCPYCLLPLSYQACFVSHLGIYKCPKCGPIQPQADIWAEKIKFTSKNQLKIKIKTKNKQAILETKLLGIYNAYNVLAAFAATKALKISLKTIKAGLKKFQPAFGRLEKIKIKNKSLHLLLVKNPTGFNQVLKTLPFLTKNQPFSCLLALNDLIADGRDVSWIWDVNINQLKNYPNLKKIIVSGTRAEDMALRLKYSKVKKLKDLKVKSEKNLKKAVKLLLKAKTKNLFILPTYTAMLSIRKILKNMGLTHSTWQD